MASGEKLDYLLFGVERVAGRGNETKWLGDSTISTGKEQVTLPPLVKFSPHSPG